MTQLEIVLNGIDEVRNSGIQCPLENVEPRRCVYFPESLIDEIVSLLKAQEPILLEDQHKPYGHFINTNSPWISRCPKCGKKIEGKQTRFCKYCGQAVKWDG